jgi:hypothetical protein
MELMLDPRRLFQGGVTAVRAFDDVQREDVTPPEVSTSPSSTTRASGLTSTP